jgi:tRNA U34 2-thiouridine synthase MnmA/TrmU
VFKCRTQGCGDKFNKSGKHKQQRKEQQIHPSSQKHNTPYKIQRQSQGMEEEKLSYLIPTIINVQILRKEKVRSMISKKFLQDVSKVNSMNVCRKDTKESYIDTVLCNRHICKKLGEHKIVILGDSHTRSLTGKLRDNLTDKFEIIGHTKPKSKTVAQV